MGVPYLWGQRISGERSSFTALKTLLLLLSLLLLQELLQLLSCVPRLMIGHRETQRHIEHPPADVTGSPPVDLCRSHICPVCPGVQPLRGYPQALNLWVISVARDHINIHIFEGLKEGQWRIRFLTWQVVFCVPDLTQNECTQVGGPRWQVNHT